MPMFRLAMLKGVLLKEEEIKNAGNVSTQDDLK